VKPDRRVIPWKRVPAKPAGVLWSAAIGWLYLDKYHAPEWLIGACAVLALILFVVVCVNAAQQTPVDPFDARQA
jgi:uncharacterized membrane protein